MYYYAGLKSRKRRFKVSPFCARPTVRFQRYDVASAEQIELESKNNSVKDGMVSLLNISHFSTKHARRNKSCRVNLRTTGYVFRTKLVSSLSRHLFGLLQLLEAVKKCFQNSFTNLNFFLHLHFTSALYPRQSFYRTILKSGIDSVYVYILLALYFMGHFQHQRFPTRTGSITCIKNSNICFFLCLS